mmetsp:Transcript_12312/g.31072  ORF Transcript_12312/g.31072 Transcript_12312/m.31072 type:complete len:207 (+) Transcript_12312:181-801(+)
MQSCACGTAELRVLVEVLLLAALVPLFLRAAARAVAVRVHEALLLLGQRVRIERLSPIRAAVDDPEARVHGGARAHRRVRRHRRAQLAAEEQRAPLPRARPRQHRRAAGVWLRPLGCEGDGAPWLAGNGRGRAIGRAQRRGRRGSGRRPTRRDDHERAGALVAPEARAAAAIVVVVTAVTHAAAAAAVSDAVGHTAGEEVALHVVE